MTARDEMGELLPCPFCGSPAEIIDIEDGENAGGSCVSCTRCEASSALDFGRKENFVAKWNTRPSPARDEGAGTMGRGKEAREMLSWLDMSIERLRGRQDLTEANLRNKYLRLRALLAAPVSAPGMDREAVARIIDRDAFELAENQISNRAIRCDIALAKADQIIALQRGVASADGSQVEPSTTGAGRHIPLEPNPFIQWNGGENPAPGKWVDVMFADSDDWGSMPSDALTWSHSGQVLFDIIAYRIIPTDDQGGEGT